jgi:hypothetical protein
MRVFLIGDCETPKKRIELAKKQVALEKKGFFVVSITEMAKEGENMPTPDMAEAIMDVVYRDFHAVVSVDLGEDVLMHGLHRELDKMGMPILKVSDNLVEMDTLGIFNRMFLRVGYLFRPRNTSEHHDCSTIEH